MDKYIVAYVDVTSFSQGWPHQFPVGTQSEGRNAPVFIEWTNALRVIKRVRTIHDLRDSRLGVVE